MSDEKTSKKKDQELEDLPEEEQAQQEEADKVRGGGSVQQSFDPKNVGPQVSDEEKIGLVWK